MAIAAKPFGARRSVMPRITSTKIAVKTISVTRPAPKLNRAGE